MSVACAAESAVRRASTRQLTATRDLTTEDRLHRGQRKHPAIQPATRSLSPLQRRQQISRQNTAIARSLKI